MPLLSTEVVIVERGLLPTSPLKPNHMPCCPDLAWMIRRSISARRGVSGLLRRGPDRRRICFEVVGSSTIKEARVVAVLGDDVIGSRHVGDHFVSSGIHLPRKLPTLQALTGFRPTNNLEWWRINCAHAAPVVARCGGVVSGENNPFVIDNMRMQHFCAVRRRYVVQGIQRPCLPDISTYKVTVHAALKRCSSVWPPLADGRGVNRIEHKPGRVRWPRSTDPLSTILSHPSQLPHCYSMVLYDFLPAMRLYTYDPAVPQKPLSTLPQGGILASLANC
ncbi:hypothetical protein V502_01180 [Pseudogymnoascus sp. VKM F-4520 (FW-2644)]|nr:hypothetical protein V502_01180 [Pseudogymnoascus sp. VKM F-4520 (FW-2644)]